MRTVTAEELRLIFHYDPETGLFTRRVTRCGRAIEGSVVGRPNRWGHLTVGINGRTYFLHRLAWLYMTGAFPSQQIDHRDGDGANNRWANLREATNQQNCRNRRRPRTGSCTGVLGVGSQYGKFQASIKVDGKKRHLGTFATKEDAFAAYRAARNAMFPDCAI